MNVVHYIRFLILFPVLSFFLCRKKLSMYASVTKVIPDIDDPSKISGCILFFITLSSLFYLNRISCSLFILRCLESLILKNILDMVDREKRVIEKFQFETNKMTAYETCNSIWSIINKQ